MSRQGALLRPLPSGFRPFESQLLTQGFQWVAGVDEAGRGCLSGPVVAAAVILPPDAQLPGVNDSKQLTAQQRDALFEVVQARAVAFGVGEASPQEIDTLNILRASHLAMVRAIAAMTPFPDILLIDGNQPILRESFVLGGIDRPLLQRTIVKGDSLCLSIAAASILAKVTRDRRMEALAKEYPAYGFEIHKGYPTALHREALKAHGPSPVHRQSFRGVMGSIDADGTEASTGAEVLPLFVTSAPTLADSPAPTEAERSGRSGRRRS